MNILQKQLVKFLLSKSGPVIQKIITAIAAGITTWLASKLPGVTQFLNQEVLLGIIWVCLDAIVTKLPADIIKEYGKQLQEALNASGGALKVDGFVGPATVSQAELLIRK